MIGWLIGVGYLLVTFGVTRYVYAYYTDSLMEQAETGKCTRTCVTDYHSGSCPKALAEDYSPWMVVFCSFLIAALWPITAVLVTIMEKPTRRQRQRALQKQLIASQAETEKLKKEYDL